MTPALGRRAGIVAPLFSCPSRRSWGIGEIPDLALLMRWMRRAGLRALQILPANEMSPGEQSPYASMSAMAVDPLFLRVPDIEDFAALGGEQWLSAEDRAALGEARRSRRVEYAAIRALKTRALAAAFARFYDHEWRAGTPRAGELGHFIAEEAWWVDPYALYRAIHHEQREQAWLAWPERLARRESAALDKVRRRLESEVLFRQYLQWQAARQWRDARAAAPDVALLGDLPFMVSGDSADVWARQDQFLLDVSLGVPPDAFSATGQNWGLPVYRWDAVAADNFAWLRERGRRSAELYDGFRIDHLVGFYRTYGWPVAGGEPFFTPAAEADQVALGERVLSVFGEAGAAIFAEDLGTVPDFVRKSLARLGIPGFRVLRWEREWRRPGQPFRDPPAYPARSVATSGTHDTETMAEWWDQADTEERAAVAGIPAIAARSGGGDLSGEPFGPAIRDLLLETLYSAGSDLLLLPVQDVFGWRDRVNVPATTDHSNWTFRLPWPVDALGEIPEAQERQQTLRRWAEAYQRL